jgi:hypothetical protein
MTEVDQYDFWRRRLAGEVVPIHDAEPQAGFYRARDKAGNWHAVAIWYGKDGKVKCRVGGLDIAEQAANERWPYVSKNPITHEVYKSVIAGNPWPFQNEAVLRDNGAPAEETFETLKDRIDDLARDAFKLIKAGGAKSQDESDRAADLANRLAELQKQADFVRAQEKRPHDEAAKAVQAKWLPVLAVADVYKQIKLLVITPFLRAEKARLEAAAAEAAKAGAASDPISTGRPAAPKAGAGGRRAVALRSRKIVTINDRAQVLAFFAGSERVTALLQELAEKAAAAGVSVPGITVTDEEVAA